jgi:hypothetical protein
MQAAKPVAAPDRDAFLRDIAAELGKHEVPRRDSAGTLDSFWRADRILRRGEGLARRAKLTSAGGRWNYSAKVIYGLQPLADAQWGLHSTGRRNRVRPWVCWERRRRHGCTRGYRRANALAPIHRLCAQGGIGIPRIPKPDLGTHTNEIEGTCSPWVFLRTNAPSAAVPQSDAFCQVPTFVTTGAPPGNKTIMKSVNAICMSWRLIIKV